MKMSYRELINNVVIRTIGNGEAFQEQEIIEEYLFDIPHRKIMDIYIFYYVKCQDGKNRIVTNAVMRSMQQLFPDFSEEELYVVAVENTVKYLRMTMHPINRFLITFHQNKIEKMAVSDDRIALVSNIPKRYGACVFLIPRMVHEIAIQLGGDIFLIPTSTHELIAANKKYCSKKELASILEKIKEANISPTERMSASIYEYSPETRRLAIVINYEKFFSGD